MYFLPFDLIGRYPTLRSLPRCFGDIASSEKLVDVVMGDVFLNEIMDAVSSLVFPHFGFSGWKEHYTGFFPAWQLSYDLALWDKMLEEETGWSLQLLFRLPRSDEIPFFDPDFIRDVIGRVVKRGIEQANLQPILDVVREMPCDEDFERWNTNVRIDFYRKWYHTRSKHVQTISLESCLEDDDHGIHEMEDKFASFEDSVINGDFCMRFIAGLSEKDIEILGLRYEGFTYEEIAEKLSYKNHSGVVKRIQAIKRDFVRYEQEQR
jgi:hypothetical protein